ncbi:MAG TPA: ECF transporter S component [Ruminiclostridium sp.]|jgi:thiamine transporter ThiT|nr:ECF transporter S component [Clostridiaceae bacterium]HAA25328.1 ECF transporter S component [Ruminiclostridium sp.]
MRRKTTKKMILTALFIALGLVLPFLTGQVPQIGSMLLPMHIPVLLCGFVCGAPFGLAAGFITPLLRSLVFGMPQMMPTAVAMAFELAAYGFVSGLLYRLFQKRKIFVYASLIISMICGRIVWGIVSYFLYGLSGTAFTWRIFAAGAFINAVPGIILQIVIIPLIVFALEKGNLIESE